MWQAHLQSKCPNSITHASVLQLQYGVLQYGISTSHDAGPKQRMFMTCRVLCRGPKFILPTHISNQKNEAWNHSLWNFWYRLLAHGCHYIFVLLYIHISCHQHLFKNQRKWSWVNSCSVCSFQSTFLYLYCLSLSVNWTWIVTLNAEVSRANRSISRKSPGMLNDLGKGSSPLSFQSRLPSHFNQCHH